LIRSAEFAAASNGTRAWDRRKIRRDIPALPYCRTELTVPRPWLSAYPKQVNSIGDHIRKRRLDLGLLQKQAAELIGVDKDTICNWEGQRKHPALSAMPAIARFLGYDPSPVAETLGGRLVRYRVSLGITQEELAVRLGVNACTLARWERGQRQPTGLYHEVVEKLLTNCPRLEDPSEIP
jgi:transcriptional regulator with XRE-family HTH domain